MDRNITKRLLMRVLSNDAFTKRARARSGDDVRRHSETPSLASVTQEYNFNQIYQYIEKLAVIN